MIAVTSTGHSHPRIVAAIATQAARMMHGTVASMSGRGPFDWDQVGEDSPVSKIVEVVRILSRAGKQVIFMSGRDGSCREDSARWLDRNVIEGAGLYMHKAGDSRKDSIVKKELYETYIRPHYTVFVVLDDRNQVVDMWRSLGLVCLQVASGDF